jgi:hypothetical protein
MHRSGAEKAIDALHQERCDLIEQSRMVLWYARVEINARGSNDFLQKYHSLV